MPLNLTALSVFVFFFALVTFVGFAAARWKRGNLDQIHEWGLAGGKFGTLITWFLLGGDLYTAYTFIAVPAAAALLIAPLLYAVLRFLVPLASEEGTERHLNGLGG